MERHMVADVIARPEVSVHSQMSPAAGMKQWSRVLPPPRKPRAGRHSKAPVHAAARRGMENQLARAMFRACDIAMRSVSVAGVATDVAGWCGMSTAARQADSLRCRAGQRKRSAARI